ncbi:MAG: elongation factor P maturation arginine rhamnosyltransferase EarP [Candidatus Gracilibacteria bacterium]|nr:elongation factor P maturation arginine rhamnosyltransferase EarP [Candidatus Gracilibacteria bacterium]
MKIDFYVDVVDNFGDLGFALNLAFIMLKNDNSYEITLFSNDEKLFKNMLKKNDMISKIKYHELSEIGLYEPSSLIFNFFDRKIDFDYLNSFDKNIKLINFGYFLLHTGVEKLHLTNYSTKNVDITHFIPSLLDLTGGVLINKSDEISSREQYFDLISKKYNLSFPNLDGKKIVSIFVYKNTLDKIINHINLSKKDDTFFLIFGHSNLILKNKNAFVMPFLEIDDYGNFLRYCDINFVRGENSLIQSLIFGKPTIWDIYKENNNAHIEKIDDFLNFLSKIEGNNKSYNDLMKKFSGENIEDGFSIFLNNYKDYEDMFKSLGNYVNNNCDLYEKIKKILN